MNNTGTLTDMLKDLGQGSFIQIGLIIGATLLLIALTQRLLPWLAERFPAPYRLYVLASVPVVRLILLIVAIGLITPKLIEPKLENLIAVFGALGLAIGFALKDYVSSLIAGIVSLYEMSYRVGDWIEIDGAYGEVKFIGLRATEIVTPDDTVVVIPHLKLWDKLVFNANDGGQNLLCVANFYLHPRHDASLVKHTLRDVALTSAFLRIQQPINVIVLEKPWGTHYRLKAYPLDPRDQFHFITDLTVRGKEALTKLKVEFVSTSAISEITP